MKAGLTATLLVMTVMLHWPVGVAEFTFDDRDFVQVNASIRSFPAAADALLPPFPPDLLSVLDDALLSPDLTLIFGHLDPPDCPLSS